MITTCSIGRFVFLPPPRPPFFGPIFFAAGFLEMLNFTASEVHKQIGALFNPKMTPEMKEVQLAYIERRLNALEKLLEGKQYANGGKFSIADAYLFTILNWTGLHKIDLAKWPNIKAFQARMAARPKVQETMKAEGLVK